MAPLRLRDGFHVFALLLSFFSSLLIAGTAFAAEIIDVRVGQHPTFTRVVFELDAAAGYQLSKSRPSTGNEELVVTLQATSIPRRVQAPRRSLLGLVRVSPDGRQSVARIELGKKGLVVKERIMSSPYRIVLDVQDPNATAAKPKPKPKPAPAPVVRAEPEPVPIPTPAPTPKAAPKPPEPKPAPKAAATPPPAPKPAPIPVAEPEPPAPAAPEPEPEPEFEDDLLGAGDDDLDPGAGRPLPGSTAEPSEGGIATMGQEDRVAPPSEPIRQAQIADEEGGGLGTLLTFVGVIALVGVGAFAVLKLRGRGGDDAEADDADAADDDANPFARMERFSEDQPAAGPPAATAAAPDGPQLTLDSLVDDMPTPAGGDATSAAPEPDLAATTVTARDVDGDDDLFGAPEPEAAPAAPPAPEPPAAPAAPTPPAPPPDDGPTFAPEDDEAELSEEEMAKLIQQFEARVAALESRLDEQNEARERLERQVAAQTEELRVQRAAIARTQRAVRNLTRGEEDGPTEPALRDG